MQRPDTGRGIATNRVARDFEMNVLVKIVAVAAMLGLVGCSGSLVQKYPHRPIAKPAPREPAKIPEATFHRFECKGHCPAPAWQALIKCDNQVTKISLEEHIRGSQEVKNAYDVLSISRHLSRLGARLGRPMDMSVEVQQVAIQAALDKDRLATRCMAAEGYISSTCANEQEEGCVSSNRYME